MSKVWLSQLKCPMGHCVLAAYDVYESEADAEALREKLLKGFEKYIAEKAVKRECFICGSKDLHTDLNPTRFRTKEEAREPMLLMQEMQSTSAALIKRLRRAGRN
jgi:hypothetical protein